MVFRPTFSWFPCSYSFPLHWPSPTLFQPVSLTSVLAESIRRDLHWHSPPPALGILEHRCQCLALFEIQLLPCNCLCCHLDYPPCHSCQANCVCPPCCQVRCHHHFGLDDGQFFWFRGYFRFEFVIQGGCLLTSWWERRCFGQFKCSGTILLRVWPEYFDSCFHVQNVSCSWQLLVLSPRFLLCST